MTILILNNKISIIDIFEVNKENEIINGDKDELLLNKIKLVELYDHIKLKNFYIRLEYEYIMILSMDIIFPINRIFYTLFCMNKPFNGNIRCKLNDNIEYNGKIKSGLPEGNGTVSVNNIIYTYYWSKIIL